MTTEHMVLLIILVILTVSNLMTFMNWYSTEKKYRKLHDILARILVENSKLRHENEILKKEER